MENNAENITIMIVDDSPTNHQILKHCFNRIGYQVISANNGKRALEMLESNIPDLIVLDIMMPEMDGYETIDRLKKDDKTKDIPVVFITAISKSTEKVKAFKAGAVDYITKPFQQDEILTRITTQIELKKQKQNFDNLKQRKNIFSSFVINDMEIFFKTIKNDIEILKSAIDNSSKTVIKNIVNNINISIDETYERFEKASQSDRFC